MPSGLGAMPRCISGVAITSLSLTGAARFSGAPGTVSIFGFGFTGASTVLFDGVALASTFVSASQLDATFDQSTTWRAGARTVTVTTGALSATATFTVTQHPNIWAEYDPGTPSARTTAGSALTSLLDLSGNARHLTVAGGSPTLASAQMNGRDAYSASATTTYLEEASASGLHLVGASFWARAVQSSIASAADSGIFGWKGFDSGGGDWLVGGQSVLLANDRWAIGLGATQRGGSTLLAWSAGENFIEDAQITSTAPTLRKNGTSTALDVGSTAADYRPSLSLTSASKLRLFGCQNASAAYTGYAIGFSAAIASAEQTQVRRFLGALFGVTVP